MLFTNKKDFNSDQRENDRLVINDKNESKPNVVSDKHVELKVLNNNGVNPHGNEDYPETQNHFVVHKDNRMELSWENINIVAKNTGCCKKKGDKKVKIMIVVGFIG